MGEIIRASCTQCGMQKEIYVGGGLRDCYLETILNALPEGQRGTLEAMAASGTAWISITRKLCGCSHCGNLYALPVVTCDLDGAVSKWYGECPQCGEAGSEKEEENSTPHCPSCQAELLLAHGGLWD